MEQQREALVNGQQETCMTFDVVDARSGQERFVACTVTGPENALCLRLNRRTVRQMMRTLAQLEREL